MLAPCFARCRATLLTVFSVLSLLAVPAQASPRDDDPEADSDGDSAWPGRVPNLPQPQPCAPAREPTPCSVPVTPVPSVGDVIAFAYAAAGLDHSPGGGWIRRARLSGLVPWVTVRTGRDTTWQDRDANIGHGTSIEVRATWRLDRLAFDARELQVASIEAARRRERRRIATRVIRVYFSWSRAIRAAEGDPRWALAAAEALAELDALTDGRFTRALAPVRKEL